MTLGIKLNKDCAVIPKQNGDTNVYDLISASDHANLITKGTITTVETGISIKLPSKDYVAILCSKCKLTKKGIILLNAADLITREHGDDDIELYFTNITDEDYYFRAGDVVAQFIVLKAEELRFYSDK